ncbi:MAG: hypothetical protein ACKPB9_34275, partial [Dolichospermum sp.]
ETLHATSLQRLGRTPEMSNSKISADIRAFICASSRVIDDLRYCINYSLLTDLSVIVLVVLHDQKEISSGLTRKFMYN